MSLEKKFGLYLQTVAKRFKLERKLSDLDRQIALLINNSDRIIDTETAETVLELVDERNSIDEKQGIAIVEQDMLQSEILDDLKVFENKPVLVGTGKDHTEYYLLTIKKNNNGDCLDYSPYDE